MMLFKSRKDAYAAIVLFLGALDVAACGGPSGPAPAFHGDDGGVSASPGPSDPPEPSDAAPPDAIASIDGSSALGEDTFCSSDRWCWANGLVQGNSLHAVWGSSAADVWAAGDTGTLLHWDGVAWRSFMSGTRADLRGLWGMGPHDVWAVGKAGTVLHFDGARWASVASGTTADLFGVSGSDATHVWAAGSAGTIVRWGGSGWSGVPGLPAIAFRAVLAAGPDDVHAVGQRGDTVHFDGSTWTPAHSSVTFGFVSVWGKAPDAIYAASDEHVFRWDGSKWVARRSDPAEFFSLAAGSSQRDIWIYSESDAIHYDDVTRQEQIHEMPGFGEISAAWASGPNDVWAVGEGGRIVHFDGTAWQGNATHHPTSRTSIGGTSNDDVWAGDEDRGALHWDGGAWTSSGTFMSPVATRTIIAFAPNDVWAAGWDLHHFDGVSWTSSGEFHSNIASMWGDRADDLWLGSGYTLRRTPAGFEEVRYPGPPFQYSALRISGNSDHDVWTVSYPGEAAHWDGASWTFSATGLSKARALWTSGRDVFVGGDSAIAHFDGGAWSVTAGLDATINAIRGRSATDVWAVGVDGAILHWDGATWRRSESGTRHALRDLWIAPTGDVWVAGDHGTVLRRTP